jgi:RNA polymerase sigma-B factor
MRRRLVAVAEVTDLLAGASSPHPGPDEAFSRSEDQARLVGALRLLPDEQREVVVLAYFGGLSQSQIAEQVGISQMHVSRLIRRSLEKIREEIAADEEVPAKRAAR